MEDLPVKIILFPSNFDFTLSLEFCQQLEFDISDDTMLGFSVIYFFSEIDFDIFHEWAIGRFPFNVYTLTQGECTECNM